MYRNGDFVTVLNNSLLNNLLPLFPVFSLSKFDKLGDFLSIGNGQPNPDTQNSFYLSNHIITLSNSNISIQNNISNGPLFAKYEFVINSESLKIIYITEVGLSKNDPNHTIFNYFSLISNENPLGLRITDNEELHFEVVIFLNIKELDSNILTSGNNPFISYLLGNGLGDVFVSFGSNYSENIRLERELNENLTLNKCVKSSNITDNSLQISFSFQTNLKNIDEIIFSTNNEVFARKNLKQHNQLISDESTFTSENHYIIKIDNDIHSIDTIIDTQSQQTEQNFFVSKYANSFGDKIHLPFNNLFNYTNPRFLSKDGNLLFFISNEKVYGYKNENFTIKQIDTTTINNSYIKNIISFENFVFVISEIHPFISSYIISDNSLIELENNFSSMENIKDIEEYFQLDITRCKNNIFILGVINKNKNARSIYFTLNNLSFEIINELKNNKEFNYLVSMYKNNFSDGQIIYLKEGPSSAECRIVTHSATQEETDIYSSLAYHLTNNASKIYSKNRALISEKNHNSSIVIYCYPQIYEYILPLETTNTKNYISNNLNYIIQQFENSEFKIYNLIGYSTPEEFINSISDNFTNCKILDFEFMKDSILIFTDDTKNSIIAYNLKLNKTQIENTSKNNSSYLVRYKKYDKVGSNNKTTNFNLHTRIFLWSFLNAFIKL